MSRKKRAHYENPPKYQPPHHRSKRQPATEPAKLGLALVDDQIVEISDYFDHGCSPSK
jgi:hypothetical protein